MKKVIQLLGITLGLVAVFGFSFTSNNITQNAEHGETFAPKVQDSSIHYVMREHGETF
ncbi:hypothetical protein BWGOE3_55610 [Bacillus mycoides]|uniref:Phr family secreted Rap phosphatase inhibitor n=1 Tax=Bacillus mycoides TaxID=1405 RepID=A0A1E8BV49_BACMY|nr:MULTISPECIES: hypothetical protein [Bacillus cereus group]EJV57195.1 hypothetical protein IEM_04976 [Bacillus cereus BAG6O-2]OFD36995.1 hypothetical protein BWGOE3_55610 [Bacillus mycoides]OFE02279.1 hypothetical protein BWGOE11_02030 [Bacillus mycoides]OFE03304.1 hypothetical protein BWGOE13_10220 [Bacillus mycoides]